MENIVIRGMACQFSGAKNLAAYWEIIQHNKISTRTHSENPIDPARNHTPGGYIKNVDQFDADFFGISNREALLMDPQQRLLLQNAWHAIENANIAPETLRGSNTGVFVGAMANDWFSRSVDDDALNSQMITGNGLALLANRISYIFDFKGPSLSIDSACSSSLLALNSAIQSLRQHECDYALVAGVNVIATSTLAQFYQCSGIASASGICQPFSKNSDGIVRSEGVGVILLSRKTPHLNGYAEIVGGSINHNGQSNGISSPNRFSQQELIHKTYDALKLASHDMAYIECHGTGTALGDRIELLALDSVMQSNERTQPCAIGSVKGLIGHAEAASGIAGIIKLALMLHHQYLPETLYSDCPNPLLEKSKSIQLPASSTQLTQYNTYMGISSFGLGGTNAHFVLQNVQSDVQPEFHNESPLLFTLSAPDSAALKNQVQSLAEFIRSHPAISLCELNKWCYTLKRYQKVKMAWVASSTAALIEQLDAYILQAAQDFPLLPKAAYYLSNSKWLNKIDINQSYLDQPAYAQALQRCDALMYPLLGFSVKQALIHPEQFPQNDQLLPIIFAHDYALTQFWIKQGIQAKYFVGEGIGEYVIACIAGLLTIEQATQLVVHQANLFHQMPLLNTTEIKHSKAIFLSHYQSIYPEHANPTQRSYYSCYLAAVTQTLPIMDDHDVFFEQNTQLDEKIEHYFSANNISIILSNIEPKQTKQTFDWVSDHFIEDTPHHLIFLAQLFKRNFKLNLDISAPKHLSSNFPYYKFKNTRYWLEAKIQHPVPNTTDQNDHIKSVHQTDQFIIQAIASILNSDIADITADLNLTDDLGLDSIVVIELLDILNKELPVQHQLQIMDTMRFTLVSDLIKHFKLLQQKSKTKEMDKESV